MDLRRFKASIYRGSNTTGQTNVILNVRIVFNSWMKSRTCRHHHGLQVSSLLPVCGIFASSFTCFIFFHLVYKCARIGQSTVFCLNCHQKNGCVKTLGGKVFYLQAENETLQKDRWRDSQQLRSFFYYASAVRYCILLPFSCLFFIQNSH